MCVSIAFVFLAQVATEQKYLDDAIAWLAAFPELLNMTRLQNASCWTH